MTALDGVHLLVDEYCVPYEKIIAVSHSEFDIRMLIEKKGIEVFEKSQVTVWLSEFLYCASITRGVKRIPMVVSIAVDYSEFHSDVFRATGCVGSRFIPRRRDLRGRMENAAHWRRRRQKRQACLSRWRVGPANRYPFTTCRTSIARWALSW